MMWGQAGGLQADVSGPAGVSQERLQVLAARVQQDRCLVQVERFAVPGPRQRPAHSRRRDAVRVRCGPAGLVSFSAPVRPFDLAVIRVAAEISHSRTLRGNLLPLALLPLARPLLGQAGRLSGLADRQAMIVDRYPPGNGGFCPRSRRRSRSWRVGIREAGGIRGRRDTGQAGYGAGGIRGRRDTGQAGYGAGRRRARAAARRHGSRGRTCAGRGAGGGCRRAR